MKFMILNEKGKQAEKFANFLGGQSGFLKSGDSYDIVHASGHLLKYKKPQDNVPENYAKQFNDWKNLSSYPWDTNLFKWEYEINPSGKPPTIEHSKKLLKTIKSTSVGQDAIIIATDNDPSGEGDVLAWEIINYIGWKGQVYRLHFKSESKEDILKAFTKMTNAREGDDQALYHAGLARQRFDYISQELSPYATIVAREHYSTDALRLGRLKSVINMVVWYQNYLRKNYIKKPFFEVRFKDNNNHVFKREYTEDSVFRFNDKSSAKAEKNNYHNSQIKILSKETKRQQPPALLSLSDLNVLVSKDGFSDTAFDSTYESMYQNEIVSYPRTEDTKITQGDFDELLPFVDKMADVVGIDKSLLTHRTLRAKHKIAHDDHGANRPGIKVPNSLAEIEKKFGKVGVSIYTHIVQSYLSILCEDYVYEQEKACLQDYPTFQSTINKPIQLNYKKIFDEKALIDSTKTDENDQSDFSEEAAPYIYEGSNPKPAKPTKSFLNNFLKKHNLGTGATRIAVFKTLGEGNKSTMRLTKKDGYVLNYNGKLSALLTKKAYIASVKVTYRLQELIQQVRDQKLDWKQIPPLMNKIVAHDMPIIQKNSLALNDDSELQKLAAEANPEYEKKEKAEGIWLGKQVKISKSWRKHEFSDQELTDLFADKVITFKAEKKDGTFYIAKGKLYNQTASVIKNGRKTQIKFVGFALLPQEIKADENHFVGIWKKKKVRVFNRCGSHIFTKQEQSDLLADKKITFDGISKKNGKTYKYTVTGKLGYKTFKGNKLVEFKPKFN